MNRKWASGLGLTVFILAGCSAVYEGKYDFNDGWREAEVMEIAGASEIKKLQFSDCRDSATPEQLATGRFAVLAYKRMGRTRAHVVPLKPSETFRPGDLVYTNVTSCDTPLVPRAQSIVK